MSNLYEKYIKKQKGKKIWGGIVIFKDGRWQYNDEEVYIYNEKDISNWKVLEL